MLVAAASAAHELAARYRALERFAAELASALEEASEHAAPVREHEESLRPSVARVQTPTGAVGALLDFQEQLASLEGVLKVTVAGSTNDRTTFLVELEPDDEAHRHREVCVRCGRVLAEGMEPASHGLCEDCRSQFGR